MITLTARQLEVLRQCEREVSIIIGSGDATVPQVRRDVLHALRIKGLIKWEACANMNAESEWKLTDEGKALLRSFDKFQPYIPPRRVGDFSKL